MLFKRCLGTKGSFKYSARPSMAMVGPRSQLWASLLHFPGVGKAHSALQALLKMHRRPWLVWLSGLCTGLQAKGHRFKSQSGHMPGLPAMSPVGGM